MILNLFKILVEMKGSDLHIIAGRPPAVRVHGELTPVPGMEKLSPEQVKSLIYEILTKEQIHHFEKDPENRTAKPYVYDKFTHETLKNIPRHFVPGKTPSSIHPVS